MAKAKQGILQFWKKLTYTMVFTSALTLGTVVYMSMIDNTPVNADMFAPSHYCSKPFKPYSFEDENEISAFQDEVDTYRMCINDFIDEQEEAIRAHQEAMEDAINEWNNFVNYELQ